MKDKYFILEASFWFSYILLLVLHVFHLFEFSINGHDLFDIGCVCFPSAILRLTLRNRNVVVVFASNFINLFFFFKIILQKIR